MGGTDKKQRYDLLDSIRGFTMISMILYHGVWDLVYLYGVKWDWYYGTGAYIWQQSICWVFIFLSGFCWSLGSKPLKRGLTVFAAGIIISAVTCFFMPESRVIFGILTLIGSCMILMIPLHKLLRNIPEIPGMIASAVLFVLTKNINEGSLGFHEWKLAELPQAWYQGDVAAFLGFPGADFWSADYFSLFPWLFLFVCGYFSYYVLKNKNILDRYFMLGTNPFKKIGQHSLSVYMLHQPVLYILLQLMSVVCE